MYCDEKTKEGESLELTVPIPYDEGYRLRILRETGLLDSSCNDPYFDRFTCLCQRLFKVSKSRYRSYFFYLY